MKTNITTGWSLPVKEDHDAKVILAYSQLINENTDKPVKGEATFTQAKLIGRIHNCGLAMDGIHLITENKLRQDIAFTQYFTIIPSVGFYDTVNGHATITFKQKQSERPNTVGSGTA